MEGQAKAVAAVSSAITSRRGSISGIHTMPSRPARSPSTRPSTSLRISGVSGAPAHSTICTSGGSWATARRNSGSPFCRVIRPTKTTEGRSGSTPSSRTRSGFGVGRQSSVSMPLCTTWTRAGSMDGVRRQHVVAHRRGHRDHGRRGLVGRLLHPRRHGVPATELLGLPGPQRLQGVRADDVRHAVQQRGEVAGEVGVPGVGVDQVGAGAAVGDREVHAQGLEGAVGVRELGVVGVRRRQRLVARRTEGVHAGLHVAAAPQRPDQLGDVHPRAAVDLRGVLLAEDVDTHVVKLPLPVDGRTGLA